MVLAVNNMHELTKSSSHTQNKITVISLYFLVRISFFVKKRRVLTI